MSRPLPEPTEEFTLPVQFGEVSAFLRQLIHDVRNSFNALDLQLSATVDIAENPSPELVQDVNAARRMIADEAKRLVKLADQIRGFKVDTISYPVGELVEDLQDRVGRVIGPEAAALAWSSGAQEGSVAVDVERFFAAAAELLRNALHFREKGTPVGVRTQSAAGHLELEIEQQTATVDGDPAGWGLHPFRSTRRGGYGLGLFAARRTLSLLRGTLDFSFASGVVRTRVTLPLVTET